MDKNNELLQKKICEQDEYYSEIIELCEGVTEARFYPWYGENSWKCACGHENASDADTCESCTVSRDRLKIIFSELFLIQRRSENLNKKRIAEKRRAEEEAEKWRKIDPDIDRIYNDAQVFEETRDNYIAAAEKLERIKGYKDAEAIAAEYRALAESAPVYDRKTLKERRKRTAKKISLVVFSALAVIFVIYAALYFTLIAPDGMRYEISGDEVTITSYDTFFGGKHAKIPEEIRGKKVTAIGNDAFSGASALISVEIPNSVTKIGQNAFKGCKSLKEIVIPESVSELGAAAFMGCSSLTRAEIYGDIKIIKISAFSECSELSKITLAKPLSRVETTAFYNCGNVKIIKFGGTREQWEKMTVENGNPPFEKAAVVFEYNSKNEK